MQEQGIPSLCVRERDLRFHERGGRLLERARGLARRGIPHDHAVLGILRVAVDAGEGERLRVRPSAVAVVALHVGGTVGDDGVELRFRREPARERAVEPAPAQHPGPLRVGGREGLDARLHRLDGRVLDQVDTLQRQGTSHEVDMGVVEARKDQPPRKVADLRLRSAQGGGARGVAHVDDPIAPHRDRLRPRPLGVGGPDPGPREDQIGGRTVRFDAGHSAERGQDGKRGAENEAVRRKRGFEHHEVLQGHEGSPQSARWSRRDASPQRHP